MNKSNDIADLFHFLSGTGKETDLVEKKQLIFGLENYDLGFNDKELSYIIDKIENMQGKKEPNIGLDKFKTLFEVDQSSGYDLSQTTKYAANLINKICKKPMNQEFQLTADDLVILFKRYNLCKDKKKDHEKKLEAEKLIKSISTNQYVDLSQLEFLIRQFYK